MRRTIIGICLLCAVECARLCGQLPTHETANKTSQPSTPSNSQPVQPRAASPGVLVNPAQPYRPIPASRVQPRESIFEFYVRALNPRRINWGEEIDRRLAILVEQPAGNPYFRACAIQTGLVLFLLLLCWVWWDKMRQIKWVAAECLADAINAKRLADQRAFDAIQTHNRHIEMCNRVIEQHESGIATGKNAGEWQQQVQNLQTQLANERAENARIGADLKRREEMYAQMESRVAQMEERLRERRDEVNTELVARVQRAEAELNNRKSPRK